MNEIIAGKNNHRVELLVLQPRSGTNLRDVVQGCTSFLKELEKKKKATNWEVAYTSHIMCILLQFWGMEKRSQVLRAAKGKLLPCLSASCSWSLILFTWDSITLMSAFIFS